MKPRRKVTVKGATFNPQYARWLTAYNRWLLSCGYSYVNEYEG